MFQNYTPSAIKSVIIAYQLSQESGDHTIRADHLLCALLNANDEIDNDFVKALSNELRFEQPRAHANSCNAPLVESRSKFSQSHFGNDTNKLFDKAEHLSAEFQRDYVDSNMLLFAVLVTRAKDLQDRGLQADELIKRLRVSIESTNPGSIDQFVSGIGASLTSDGRHILKAAVDESIRAGHSYIGTEQILISLVGVQSSVYSLFTNLPLSVSHCRAKANQLGGVGPETRASSSEYKFTPGAKLVLRHAQDLAKTHNLDQVNPQCILFAILSTKDSMAVEVLENSGVDVAALKKQVLLLLKASASI